MAEIKKNGWGIEKEEKDPILNKQVAGRRISPSSLVLILGLHLILPFLILPLILPILGVGRVSSDSEVGGL